MIIINNIHNGKKIEINESFIMMLSKYNHLQNNEESKMITETKFVKIRVDNPSQNNTSENQTK